MVKDFIINLIIFPSISIPYFSKDEEKI